MGNAGLDQLLKEGIAAARAGQKEQARELLLQVIALDEATERAWLWLSGLVDDPEERKICLENVLALNPSNTAARAGLAWLAEQKLMSPFVSARISPPGTEPTSGALPTGVAAQPGTPQPPPEPRTVLTTEQAGPGPPQTGSSEQAVTTTVEIDPYGCPYCGGSVGGEDPACDHCRRPVTLRYRKRSGGMWLGGVVVFFALQGAVAFAEGFLVSHLLQMGALPAWLSQSAMRLLIGTALLSSGELPGNLVEFADLVVLVNTIVGGLCLLAALGLALRSRVAYFGSFLLTGLLVIAAGAGLLTQLSGLLPVVFRLGLAAISLKWLVDSAPAFEWETRRYNADLDSDLRTDLDYYNRGLRYKEMRMWAKAAAHWQVATQLAPGEVKYHAALASAYFRMEYPDIALARANLATALARDDEELRAFRDFIARSPPDFGSGSPRGAA